MLSSLKHVIRDSLLLRDACPAYALQAVRWKRKPRWVPVAKSKLYRIPQRPKVPEEEKREIMRLYNNYRTEMKSLQLFFAEKTRASETGEEVIAEQQKLEEEEFQRCLKLNDDWNKNVAATRVARLAVEKERELENIIREVEETKKKQLEKKARLEALVREEKERSKTYITAKNIDEAIEKALSSEVNYDYAIDTAGNKYVGRRARPGNPQPPTPPS